MKNVPIFTEDHIREYHHLFAPVSGCELEYVLFTDYRKLEKKFQQLQAENERLKEALQEIATNKFCSYAENEQSPYGFGVTDGHRYCQAIAQQALEKK